MGTLERKHLLLLLLLLLLLRVIACCCVLLRVVACCCCFCFGVCLQQCVCPQLQVLIMHRATPATEAN